jgi:hypothetical protein
MDVIRNDNVNLTEARILLVIDVCPYKYKRFVGRAQKLISQLPEMQSWDQKLNLILTI